MSVNFYWLFRGAGANHFLVGHYAVLFTVCELACDSQVNLPSIKAAHVNSEGEMVGDAGKSEVETAVIGGGCFWCLEPVFKSLRGVSAVQPGYAGGERPHPSYESVCSGHSGHAEVIEVVFEPRQIAFDTLLEVFFYVHDPTTLNRQGHDVGSQYRSVIFCQSSTQLEEAKQAIARLDASGIYDAPVVTELVSVKPVVPFYPAEDYHHAYFVRHGHEPYCSMVISPKVAKCRQRFAALLQK